MKDTPLHTIGIIATILLHAGLGTAVALMSDDASKKAEAKFADWDNAQTMEAALAFKSTEPTKQPQKRKNPKVAPPETVGVSRDADKAPVEPKPEDKKPKPPPDMIDPTAVLNKNRQLLPDEEASDTGVEGEQGGSPNGSEWGTEREARGDPYVGELRGRIRTVWRVPTLETGAGVALGCVRLDEEGKIVERKLLQKSKNSNLDRSVEQALKDATDMEDPVPAHLIVLLTEKGVCFRFNLENQ